MRTPRARAIKDITRPMNRKWPDSTPRLKNNSAVGMCKAGSPASLNPNLRRDKDDAQADDGLDRPLRYVHKAECHRSQRDAVREGERSDCLRQFPATTRENN